MTRCATCGLSAPTGALTVGACPICDRPVHLGQCGRTHDRRCHAAEAVRRRSRRTRALHGFETLAVRLTDEGYPELADDLRRLARPLYQQQAREAESIEGRPS